MANETPEEMKERIHTLLNQKDLSGRDLKDVIGSVAQQLLVMSQIYKQPRMLTIAAFERLYNNDVLPKFRQLFNMVLPVFSGLIDALLSMYNDQVHLKFTAKNPAQYLIVPKIQAHWEAERDSLEPNALWNMKLRMDRFNMVMSGRGITKEYAYNDPEYKNVLETVNYSDFHCQPLGGAILENHLFCGTESNFRTLFELKSNPKYDKKQVKKLENFEWSDRYFENLETVYGTQFARWKALGLNVLTNSFTGEPTYNLGDFVITYNGVRYNVVFEICSGIWLYVEPWKDSFPSGRYPYKSGATHEDDKNFWSKGSADDLYTVADAIITLVNQELTNREKQNYHSQAFDKDAFTDVPKLDAAQQRPDVLVPFDSMGGVKKIGESMYEFKTAQLSGTVDLVNFLSSYTGSKTGADELPAVNTGGKKNIQIMLAQQQKQSKRVGLKTDPMQEYYSQLGLTFLEGMREFMPASVSVQVIGENGFIEETELKRIDLVNAGQIGISITSKSEQEQQDQTKKQSQVQAIQMVTENPNLTKYEKETIYRNIGGFDEQEIAFLLDTKGEISKKQIAHASRLIQDILLGKKVPNIDIYYGADISFLTYYKNWMIDHKSEVTNKLNMFAHYLQVMTPIVQTNMEQLAKQQPPQPQQEGEQKPGMSQKPKPSISLPAIAKRVGAQE